MRRSANFILTLISYMILLSYNAIAQDPNFHIYLCFGQSNMEGMAPIEAQDKTTNVRVKVLADQTCTNLNRVYGQWYTAVPPLNRCWNKLGPADYFGKAMADGTPSTVTTGLVPAAYSGCDIAFFQKSHPLGKAYTNGGENADIPSQFTGGYAWMLDLAKKAQSVGVIKGIIFHQGETNTNDPNWKNKVQEIVKDLRIDLGIGNVPFLAGELLYKEFGSCCSSHNIEVNKLPGIITNAHVISASGLNGQDEAHFNSASYRILGKRYAEKMLALEYSVTGNSLSATDENFAISMFPVPCKDIINIDIPEVFDRSIFTITIYSLDGKIVFKESFKSKNSISINTSNFPADVYICKISGDNYEKRKLFSKTE